MKKQVRKLVRVSLVTSVTVAEDATQEEIMQAAVPKLKESLLDQPMACIDEIVDDNEYPFDTVTYNKLGEYLANDAAEYPTIVENLKKALVKKPTDMVDYVDGVDVWQPIEYNFTVEEFCNLVGIYSN
jgi:hypothetical protein